MSMLSIYHITIKSDEPAMNDGFAVNSNTNYPQLSANQCNSNHSHSSTTASTTSTHSSVDETCQNVPQWCYGDEMLTAHSNNNNTHGYEHQYFPKYVPLQSAYSGNSINSLNSLKQEPAINNINNPMYVHNPEITTFYNSGSAINPITSLNSDPMTNYVPNINHYNPTTTNLPFTFSRQQCFVNGPNMINLNNMDDLKQNENLNGNLVMDFQTNTENIPLHTIITGTSEMGDSGNPSFSKNSDFIYPSYKQKYVLNGDIGTATKNYFHDIKSELYRHRRQMKSERVVKAIRGSTDDYLFQDKTPSRKIKIKGPNMETLIKKLVRWGDETHSCQECGKSFWQKCHLLRHIREQHLVKSAIHECPFCLKVFHQKSNLDTHCMTHAKDRKFSHPFKCIVCKQDGKEKCFTRKSSLKRHCQTKHKHIDVEADWINIQQTPKWDHKLQTFVFSKPKNRTSSTSNLTNIIEEVRNNDTNHTNIDSDSNATKKE